MLKAKLIWRKLLLHLTCRAFPLAFGNTDRNIPARMAIIAVTTNNSISVKARNSLFWVFLFISSMLNNEQNEIHLPDDDKSKTSLRLLIYDNPVFYLKQIALRTQTLSSTLLPVMHTD